MMLKTINKQMDKAMPLITPISVVIGVLLAEHLTDYTFLVPWILAFITFALVIPYDFITSPRGSP